MRGIYLDGKNLINLIYTYRVSQYSCVLFVEKIRLELKKVV